MSSVGADASTIDGVAAASAAVAFFSVFADADAIQYFFVVV